jgi:hypothetical protein
MATPASAVSGGFEYSVGLLSQPGSSRSLAVACPSASDLVECSGHGECMTLEQAGLFYGRDAALSARGIDRWGPRYSNWDANVTSVCVCDIGKPDSPLKSC